MILIDFLENLVIPSEVVNIFVPFGDKFWLIFAWMIWSLCLFSVSYATSFSSTKKSTWRKTS